MVNKAELISSVAAATDLPKATVETVVSDFLSKATSALAKGEDVSLSRFGIFKSAHVDERQARNPKTGEVITVEAHKRVAFKASSALKAAINK